MDYAYQTSECMPRYYPVVVFRGFLNLEEGKESRMINRGNFRRGDWGDATSYIVISKHTYSMPVSISLKWGAMTEKKAYALEAPLDKEKIELLWQRKDKNGEPLYEFIVVGIAPYGGVAVWLRGNYHSTLLHWFKGEEIDEEQIRDYLQGVSLEEYCRLSLEQNEDIKEHLEEYGLPPLDLFDDWMMQYRYRYIGLEEYYDSEQWQPYDDEDLFFDDLDFDDIREERLDGTHDQLCDDGLLKYHEAGCPKRLCVNWQVGRDNYSLYYWFDEQTAPQFFKQYFMMNAVEKADIMLRIDTRANLYEIVFKSDEMPIPQVMPADTYQLLVFLNDNEYYRSENFDQEDEEAWDW